jgi:hypothetical protein
MKKIKTIILTSLLIFSCSYNVAPAVVSFDIKSFLQYIEDTRYKNEMEFFIDQLGYDESRNDWTIINRIGAFGEFQFVYPTLKFLGYGHITLEKFKRNPDVFPKEMQREVVKILINYNTTSMKSWIEEYEGKIISGVVITKAGILASCHLGGPRSVVLFLRSNGKINNRDLFGTTIKNYMFKYQKFDLTLKKI